VPVTGTRRWVAGLGLPVRSAWHPWHVDGQVGGYRLGYEGLTFATVRGAGHMVPYTQPSRALELFRWFLAGEAAAGPA
jgi:serine carboxypeptidase-like clade II